MNYTRITNIINDNTLNSDITGLALVTGGPDAITRPNELGEVAVTGKESPDEIFKKDEHKQINYVVTCNTQMRVKSYIRE